MIRDLINEIPPETHPVHRQVRVRGTQPATDAMHGHGETRRQFASSDATAAVLKLRDRVDCFARARKS